MSRRDRLNLYPGDAKAAIGVMALGCLLILLALIDVYGDLLMKRALAITALIGAALVLSGCATPVGRTVVGPLKPMEVGIQQTVSCADLVRAIRAAGDRVDRAQATGGVGPAADVDSLRRENTTLLKALAETDAAYEVCERKEASQKVTIDLEAGRKLGLGGLVPGVAP